MPEIRVAAGATIKGGQGLLNRMPTIRVNGAELYYEDRGSGPETLVFAHGLVFDHRMYEAQVAAFSDRYRCVTFDFRGQGLSEVTPAGYDMDTLSEDAAALMDALDLWPCHFVGLSMGGFVGLRLALRYPEMLRSLALLNTSAEPEPPGNRPRYRLMRLAARWLGPGAIVGRLMPVMFGRDFLADPGRAADRERWRRRMRDNDPVGISRAAGGVIDREGVLERINGIRAPTLIVAGEQDRATTPDKARHMHERITGSELVTLPGTGHMSVLECPDRVNDLLAAFLAGRSGRQQEMKD